MNGVKALSFRVLFASLCAVLLLVGCSSSSNNPTPRPGGTYSEWRVTVRNKTALPVWLTKYWTNAITIGWHVECCRICIAPGDETTQAIEYSMNGEAKLRAEIKDPRAKGCSGATVGDVEGKVCSFDFFGKDYIRGEAFVLAKFVDRKSRYEVSTTCDTSNP